MRWYVTKKALVLLIGILVAAIFVMALTSCIPVTIRPQFDDQGLPKATPVTLVGSQNLETGQFLPVYPVSDQAPTPPKDWWPLLEQGLTLALGLLVGGGAAVPLIRRARTAIGLVANLADANASAETDEDVQRNKALNAQMQEAAGVRSLIQKVRGKS